MRSKKLNVLLSVTLAFVMLMTCVACAPSSNATECKHEVDYIYNNDATTEADGTETGVCKLCGKTLTRTAKGTKIDTSDRIKIKLQGYGDENQKEMFISVVRAFNNSLYAAANGLQLSLAQFLTESVYFNCIERGDLITPDNTVDIIAVPDTKLKKWANDGYIESLGSAWDDKIGDMYPGVVNRFRHNPNGNTSDKDDALWGVPFDAASTAIYYNRQAMENAGVIVISVDDDTVNEANYERYSAQYVGLTSDSLGKNLITLWNENKIADKFGQYHDSCGNRGDGKGAGFDADVLKKQNVVVPAKGYYRQDSQSNLSTEKSWVNPNANGAGAVVKVFNASVAMNVDELEDLARLLSTSNNTVTHGRKTESGRTVATTYGYYSEYYEDFIRAVGGDLVLDLTGEGVWMLGMGDTSANYLVTVNALDKTDDSGEKYYEGVNTGTHYKAGETLKYLDKLDVKKFAPLIGKDGKYQTDDSGNIVFNDGDMLVPAANGGVRIYNRETDTLGEVSGENASTCIRAEIKDNATDDISANPTAKFVTLPSTMVALDRFFALTGKNSGVAPITSGTATPFDTIAQFGEGKIAMVAEKSDRIGRVREFAAENQFEWGVAPLPVCKKYKNPQSDDVTVSAEGVKTGVSTAIALCITPTTKYTHREEALKVIEWLTSASIRVGETTEHAGQYYKAAAGYIPVCRTAAQHSAFIKETEKNLNIGLFFDALEYERPSAGWYMPNNAWLTYYNFEHGANNLGAAKSLSGNSYFFGDNEFRSKYEAALSWQ